MLTSTAATRLSDTKMVSMFGQMPMVSKVTTNTAESFIALIKRGHYGIFHQYSKKHLHRYIAEATFRWNHRKVSDGTRRDAAIKSADGKRLMYRDSSKAA